MGATDGTFAPMSNVDHRPKEVFGMQRQNQRASKRPSDRERTRVYEQERRVRKAERKAEEVLRACNRRLRKAERAAKEAAHRSEEVKWRIEGGGLRPRPLPAGRRSSEVSEEKEEA
jgi:hypothetical protein